MFVGTQGLLAFAGCMNKELSLCVRTATYKGHRIIQNRPITNHRSSKANDGKPKELLCIVNMVCGCSATKAVHGCLMEVTSS